MKKKIKNKAQRTNTLAKTKKTKVVKNKSTAKSKSLKIVSKPKLQTQVTTSKSQTTVQKKKVISPPQIPTRAPRRLIIGNNTQPEIVPITTQEDKSQSTEIQTPVVEKPVTLILVTKPNEKYSWEELPSYLPSHIRVLVDTARQECQKASEWPFAFAKFIALLPHEVCGLGFSFLLLSLDHDSTQIASICKVDKAKVEGYLEEVRHVIGEKFSTLCGEIYRKWVAQLVGHDKNIREIVEKYLIAKLNRNFQEMIGELVLKSIGAENPVVNGQLVRNHWIIMPSKISASNS